MMKLGVSKKFVSITAVVILALILCLIVSFYYVLNESSNLIRDLLLKNNEYLLIEKVKHIADGINHERIRNAADLSLMLKRHCSSREDVLHVILYAKTEDEHFFRVQDVLPFSPALKLDIAGRTTVQELKEKNYVREGLFGTTVEPKIYTHNALSWQNVYHPFQIYAKMYVAQFLLSASQTHTGLQEYFNAIKRIKLSVIAIACGAALVIVCIVLFFVQNFSLLIRRFSTSLTKAASGELDINLNTESDADLTELALSFNTLIDELKELKEKEKIYSERERDSLESMFRFGVTMVKENNLDSALTVFQALVLLKPDSFGSYFNLGVIHARKRNYDASLAMFGRALDLNPGNELTMDYIGKVKNLQHPQ